MSQSRFDSYESESSFRVDVVKNVLGDIGPFQIIICIFLYLVKISVAHQTFVHIFFTVDMNPHCTAPINVNDPCDELCEIINYTHPIFETTIVTEWDLICEHHHMAPISFVILTVGYLLGGIIFGHLADHLGRRPMLLVASMIVMFTGIYTAKIPWYWFFCIFRFLAGVGMGGSSILSFVLIVELTSGRKREIVTLCQQMPFVVGHGTLALFAHFLREWRSLQLGISLFSLVSLFYFCIVPESPRWLLLTGRLRKCVLILERGAIRNARRYENVRENVNEAYEALRKNTTKNANAGDLFRSPNLRRKVIVMMTIYFIMYMNYFGLFYVIVESKGNILLYVGTSGAVGVISTLLTLPLSKLFGRRVTLCISNGLTAITLFAIAFLPDRESSRQIQAGLALTSLAGLNVTFANAYLLSAELFPTILRTTAIGLCLASGAVGSILTTPLYFLFEKNLSMPPLIFAIASLLVFVLAFFLPETKQMKMLPETLEDGENFGKKGFRFGRKKVKVSNTWTHLEQRQQLRSSRDTDDSFKSARPPNRAVEADAALSGGPQKNLNSNPFNQVLQPITGNLDRNFYIDSDTDTETEKQEEIKVGNWGPRELGNESSSDDEGFETAPSTIERTNP